EARVTSSAAAWVSGGNAANVAENNSTANFIGRQCTGPARARRLAASAASSGLDGGDVDLGHVHYGQERAPGGRAVGVFDGVQQHAGRNLPRYAPYVLTPPAGVLASAIAHYGVPQTIGLGLVFGRHQERERFVMADARPTVQPQAWRTHDRELDGQRVAFASGRIVGRRMQDRVYAAVGKGRGVEGRGVQRRAVVPQADRVFAGHGDLQYVWMNASLPPGARLLRFHIFVDFAGGPGGPFVDQGLQAGWLHARLALRRVGHLFAGAPAHRGIQQFVGHAVDHACLYSNGR